MELMKLYERLSKVNNAFTYEDRRNPVTYQSILDARRNIRKMIKYLTKQGELLF